MSDTTKPRMLVVRGVRDPHLGVTLALLYLAIAALALRAYPGQDPFHIAVHAARLMPPTCGMTRALFAALRGQVALALRYNPAVLVVGPALAFWVCRSLVGLASRRWLVITWRPGRTVVALAVALVALVWVHQQLEFDWLLRTAS